MTYARSIRRGVLLLVTLAGLVVLAAFATRTLIHTAAATASQRITAALQPEDGSEQSLVLATARRVHDAFITTQHNPNPGWLTVLRPYLSHSRLPDPIRIEPGAIDVLELDGLCDAAARTLAYLLRQQGFDAAQLNIIAPTGGHSVVEVRSAAQTLMVDPFFGVAPKVDGRVLSPQEAQDRADDPSIWRPLGSSPPDVTFFRSFADAVFARQGEALEFTAEINLAPGQVLELGQIDSSSRDVEQAGNENRMSPYWGYIGSRYDRAWVRQLRFHQDTRVEFVLTDALNPRFLTMTPAPDVAGRLLTVQITAGGTLRLVDGAAERDYLELRSYQEVDRLRFEALP